MPATTTTDRTNATATAPSATTAAPSRTGGGHEQDALGVDVLRQTADTSFHNGAISRFNAWFFRALDGVVQLATRPHKRAAFAGITPGIVVELGAGVGANLRFLPEGSHLVAVEPSRAMHRDLVARAEQAGVPLTLVPGGAEELPLPDGSVDEVICSLVLCTVGDPAKVLAEVRRVLRPGGRFRFVEHVVAPAWSPRRWVQRLVRRPWGWLFEGCDPERHTPELVRAAGFADVEITSRRLFVSAFYPVNTAIWGIATR